MVSHFLGQRVPRFPGLADGEQLANIGNMPGAPNRWLVKKTVSGAPVRCWVIDSDYIYSGHCTIPYSPDAKDPNRAPFRAMGRCFEVLNSVSEKELYRF